MPRTKRIKSESGIYHIMLRGINQQQIFHEDEDCYKFLKILKRCKEKTDFNLFAYCFMGNHVHLLLQETSTPIGLIFRRLGSSYVLWYNNKYQRTGHLFQDRYKSEAVEDDEYFLSAFRYIHNNPVKAGIAKHPKDYTLSSYHAYLQDDALINTTFVWNMISKEQFEAIHFQNDTYQHIDISEQKYKLNDEQAQQIIEDISSCANVEQYQKLDYQEQLQYIKDFKAKGLSIRQISRLTGLPKGIVERR